ncbi:hypothetical protein L873DRAFT_449551 [Choiromyces venosus 120613-1]|uniref:Uncharacterized protein n=1 Tax=Choiromyces venosus 120613-1 TaxID=1336337 RepID=A0A3N4K1L2_9PEZI|nr:hypothetical protein L873DRAFT_449551 [Choiromyces venosus 120613-1]
MTGVMHYRNIVVYCALWVYLGMMQCIALAMRYYYLRPHRLCYRANPYTHTIHSYFPTGPMHAHFHRKGGMSGLLTRFKENPIFYPNSLIIPCDKLPRIFMYICAHSPIEYRGHVWRADG